MIATYDLAQRREVPVQRTEHYVRDVTPVFRKIYTLKPYGPLAKKS